MGPNKATNNLAKNNVSCHEASTVFGDLLSLTFSDSDQPHDEDRHITIGESIQRGLLIISHTGRGHRTRIINARKVTRREKYTKMTDRTELNDELRPEYD